MKTDYQVGDLVRGSWEGARNLFIITGTPEKDVYSLTCIRTYKIYGYSKEGLEALFQKVA